MAVNRRLLEQVIGDQETLQHLLNGVMSSIVSQGQFFVQSPSDKPGELTRAQQRDRVFGNLLDGMVRAGNISGWSDRDVQDGVRAWLEARR